MCGGEEEAVGRHHETCEADDGAEVEDLAEQIVLLENENGNVAENKASNTNLLTYSYI